MAGMLNMIPINPKQNIVAKSSNNKGATNKDKSELGFAKALNVETDKKNMDSETKPKNDDNVQLMSGLVGAVLPMITKPNEKVGNTEDSLKQVASATQIQLPEIAHGVVQNQVVSQAQLANVATGVSQAQLANVAPGVSQAQLANVAPGVSQIQLANVIPGAPQVQLANVAPGVPQVQLANVAPGVSQAQLANVVPGVAQAQLANVVPGVSQAQLANVVPGVSQAQLADVVPVDTNTSQNQLATLLTGKTTIKPQLNSKELGEFAALEAQAQLQMQNKQMGGQVQATGNSNIKTDMVTNNPASPNPTSLVTTVGTTTLLGKINNNKPEGKKVVVGQMNVDAAEITNNFGLVEAVDVKKLLAPQVAVAVGDRLLSENKENVDVILPNSTVKNSEVFAGMLNQQGMKIENQTAALEIKPGAAQHVADPYNITSQIVDQARLVTGAKNTEMIIQLKPDHLGELTFKVTVENGIVSASFHSNNAEVRNIIESSLPQLKQELFNHGIKTDNIGVYADQGQTFSNGQQSGGYQPPVIKVPNKKTTENFLDVLESTDSVNRALDVTGVDYRA